MGRPNILLLFTDQQRFDSLGAVNPIMKTPGLDRLAAEGCLCENAYTPNPVCMPARHNVLTGLTARYHGYAKNEGHPMYQYLPTLAEILSDKGYQTEVVGKMHFWPMRRSHGFDRLQLMEETPIHRQDDDYLMYLKANGLGHIQHQHGVRHLLYHQPQHSIIPEEHHGSKWVADRTIDFLRTTCKKPFFMWSSWIAPHPPYNVPDSWADTYKGAPIPDPIPAPQEYPPHTGDSQGTGDIEDDPVRMRRHREIYYAGIAFIDHQIGRILDELDAQGLADNTLVIFATDHGEMAGDLGIYQKSHPYEGCCHIPFLTRWPGRIDAASRRRDFVDLNDILPTCLDAAGIKYPGEHELPGESLLVAPGDGLKDRTIQYIENARVQKGMTGHQQGSNRWRQIRDERFKFTHFCNGGYELLVDTKEDPQELCNLMNCERTAEQEEAYRRLRAKLVEYETRWGVEEGIVDGDLACVERYETPGPRARRCSATPSWPPNLQDAAEIAAMNSIEDEMRAVIAKEPTVKLSKLDLEVWAKSTGFHDLAEKFKSHK